MDASPQLDLGIDSLGWLGLGMALEAATGRTLEPERLAAAETVRALVRFVADAPDAAREVEPSTGAPRSRARIDD